MRRAALLLTLALLLSGCGTRAPAPTQTPAPTPVQTPEPTPVPKVQTDWSQLGERESFTPVGSRWYADYTDRLIPSGDYGMLIPYAGTRLTDAWYASDGCRYGLMTREGAVVTDPVFLSVTRPGFERGNWEAGGTEHRTHPLLVLARGAQDGQERYAVAGADGSWCTEFDYHYWGSYPEGLLLFSDDGLVLMAPDGTVIDQYGWAELGFSPDEVQDFLWGLNWNFDISWRGEYVVLYGEDSGNTVHCFRHSDRQPVTLTWQELEQVPQQSVPGFSLLQQNGETLVVRDGETYRIPHSTEGSVDICGDLLSYWEDGAVYTLAGKQLLPPMEDGYAELLRDELLRDTAPGLIYRYDRLTEESHYYRADGSPLPFLDSYESYGARRLGLAGGLIYTLDADTVRYYDYNTLDCVFSRSLRFWDD